MIFHIMVLGFTLHACIYDNFYEGLNSGVSVECVHACAMTSDRFTCTVYILHGSRPSLDSLLSSQDALLVSEDYHDWL